MRLRHWSLLAIILTIACHQQNPMWSDSANHFVASDSIPAASVLPAPPAVGTSERAAALQAVIKKQAHLSNEEIARLRDEDSIRPQMMVEPVLGHRYQADCYPALYKLLDDAKGDTLAIGNRVQEHWNSPRPWMFAGVTPQVKKIDRPSYPSGHTAVNHVWADILTELFPAKHKAFEARAEQIAWHRVEAGAHYPFDLEGGRKLSTVIYGRMKQSPAYQNELAAAKAELKSPQARNCVTDELVRHTVPNCC